jgi:hypothetical protein
VLVIASLFFPWIIFVDKARAYPSGSRYASILCVANALAYNAEILTTVVKSFTRQTKCFEKIPNETSFLINDLTNRLKRAKFHILKLFGNLIYDLAQ